MSRKISRMIAIAAVFSLLVLMPAQASAATYSYRYTFENYIWDCSGQSVHLVGELHVVGTYLDDYHVTYHYNAHLTGASDLGNQYVMNFHQRDVNRPGFYKVDYRSILISKGSAPNIQMRFYYDSTGKFELTSICRGSGQ